MKKKESLTLVQYLNKYGIKQVFFANKIGISAVNLSRIINGKHGPTRKQCLAIEVATKGEVPMQIWDSPLNEKAVNPKNHDHDHQGDDKTE